jgi:hypothetical protein
MTALDGGVIASEHGWTSAQCRLGGVKRLRWRACGVVAAMKHFGPSETGAMLAAHRRRRCLDGMSAFSTITVTSTVCLHFCAVAAPRRYLPYSASNGLISALSSTWALLVHGDDLPYMRVCTSQITWLFWISVNMKRREFSVWISFESFGSLARSGRTCWSIH